MKKLLIITLFLAACGQDKPQPVITTAYETIEYAEEGAVENNSCSTSACPNSSYGRMEITFKPGRSTIVYIQQSTKLDSLFLYRVIDEERTLLTKWIPEVYGICQPAGCTTVYDELIIEDVY